MPSCKPLVQKNSQECSDLVLSHVVLCCVIYIFTCIAKWEKNYELAGQADMLYSVMHILTDGGV